MSSKPLVSKYKRRYSRLTKKKHPQETWKYCYAVMSCSTCRLDAGRPQQTVLQGTGRGIRQDGA